MECIGEGMNHESSPRSSDSHARVLLPFPSERIGRLLSRWPWGRLTRLGLLVLLAGSSVVAVHGEPIKLKAKPGSSVRIEGTSTVHDWTVEGSLIGGSVEVEGEFPVAPGRAIEPGPVNAKVRAFVPISSLRSVKDGKPYSTRMDEIMHEKLGKPDHKMVSYQLDTLTLTSMPESGTGSYVFDATGWLQVAGVSNAVAFPVEVLPGEDGLVRFSAKTTVKMTDYGIDPPAPKLGLGMIKTGDEVEVQLEWVTTRVP